VSVPSASVFTHSWVTAYLRLVGMVIEVSGNLD
jgi:hypothetical protein